MKYTTVYQRLRKAQIKKAEFEKIEIWLNKAFEDKYPNATGDEIQTALEDNKILALNYAKRFNKETTLPQKTIEGLDYWRLIDSLGVYTVEEKKANCLNILGGAKCEVLFRYLGV